jgi:hypothetical protein
MSTPNTAALATAIAGLTVTGVTFKDISAIPRMIIPTDCPIFFPDPDNWFSGMATDGNIKISGLAGQYDVIRTLKYIYLHSVSTAANTITVHYSEMAGKVDAIYRAIAGMNNGVAVVNSVSISRFGEIQAPQSGTIRNVFFGCFFDITFSEMVY